MNFFIYYGAILSTIVFLWSVGVYLFDRRRRLKITASIYLTNANTKKHVIVFATNLSRTITFVSNIFYIDIMNKKKSELFAILDLTDTQVPAKLQYGEAVSFRFELTEGFVSSISNENKNKIVRFLIIDSLGKRYYSDKISISE
ncbi:hypothetical protein LBMAG27_11400 [Bacteroidota bacterium]|nr:hypothetical protein LBMAG27_11400 [Bacteroidota bacterium]